MPEQVLNTGNTSAVYVTKQASPVDNRYIYLPFNEQAFSRASHVSLLGIIQTKSPPSLLLSEHFRRSTTPCFVLQHTLCQEQICSIIGHDTIWFVSLHCQKRQCGRIINYGYRLLPCNVFPLDSSFLLVV